MPRRSGIVAALVLGRRYKSGLAFPEYNLKSAHLFLRELRSLAGRFARFHPTLKRGGLSASLSCKSGGGLSKATGRRYSKCLPDVISDRIFKKLNVKKQPCITEV